MYQLKGLPVPNDQWDCSDLIENSELALEMLGEDPHYIEDHDHMTEASELLECLNPELVMDLPLSKDWKKDVLTWLFNAEVIAVCRNYDVDHYKRDEFREVCNKYIESLEKAQEEFHKKETGNED